MRLDAPQRAAATIGGGPLRVIAGAGTGKTAVIAERFRRLVASGVDPASILVMTFTERAAAEMRQRIEELIDATAPSVGTVHSIALGWLRADGRIVGVPPGFRIISGAERWILARELMWSLGDAALTADERPDDLVAPALQMLERLKQELVPMRRLSDWADVAEDAERAALMHACVRLFRAYERECRKLGRLDFDDLLERAVDMLAGDPGLLDAYRRRFPHVLVDEYQDLNLAQERLVELIAGGGAPFVVGDDDQSIYRFRGASRASLERFVSRFPAAQTITLGRNHRSSKRIVAAAGALIGNNLERLPKTLHSTKPGARVEVWRYPQAGDECAAIADEAARLIGAATPPSQIAVLCRTNAIARPVAAALAERGLPHVVFGGHGLLDRPETRDVIAMLRILRDPSDVIAIARALVRPPNRLAADTALGMLRDRGGDEPLAALMRWAPAQAFAALMHELSAEATTLDVRDLFFELMNRTRYLEALTAGLEPTEGARAAANVSRFAESVGEFCETSPDHSLAKYMEHLDLVLLSGEDESQAPIEAAGNAISVMTIHQAKGLEFDVVFVPSLVEGRLPSSGHSQRFEVPPAVLEPLVRGREDVIGEERRLLYVAMTRARRRLYLTRAEHYEGGRRWRPSRFLEEVLSSGPGVVVERIFSAAPMADPLSPPSPSPRGGEGSSKPSLTSLTLLALSYSSIQAYRDCPRQYWFRYEQRLPAVQSAEAVHGVILHDALRRAGEERRSGRPVTAALLRSLHARAWSETAFPDARRAPTFKRNGLAQLEAFRKAGGFDGTPTLVEQEFSTNLDGFTLHGVIDRVDRSDPGWRIVDYKSGRPLARARRDLQVALYGLGAAAALDLKAAELEIVYLASGETIHLEGVESLQAEAMKVASDVAGRIKSRSFEAQPERRKCRLCPYRLACEDAL